MDRNALSLSTPFGGAGINEAFCYSIACRSSERSPSGPGLVPYKYLTPNGVKPGLFTFATSESLVSSIFPTDSFTGCRIPKSTAHNDWRRL
jgi:hypothetical protein